LQGIITGFLPVSYVTDLVSSSKKKKICPT